MTNNLQKQKALARLAYIREEIENERVSYGEIAELQGVLRKYIPKDDTLLREWAGIKEQKNMKTYTIQWNRDDYGYIEIQAKNKKEAEEKFRSGDYEDRDLITRGGSIEFDSIK